MWSSSLLGRVRLCGQKPHSIGACKRLISKVGRRRVRGEASSHEIGHANLFLSGDWLGSVSFFAVVLVLAYWVKSLALPGAKMIKSLALQRFKSVRDRTELPMGPLTIFAGVNNSGKSTIIQSILLTVQTLQMPVQERPITLNGHILRLGTFDDIVSSGHADEPINIGFSMADFEDYESLPRSAQRRLPPSGIRRRTLAAMESLTCEFSFSAKGTNQQKEILQLQPNVEECSIQVRLKPEAPLANTGVSVRRRTEDPKAVASELQLLEFTTRDLRALEYKVVSGPGKVERPYSYLSEGQLVGVSLFHFLPRFLLFTYDAVEENARQILRAFTAPHEPWEEELDEGDFAGLPEQFKTLLMEACETIAVKAIKDNPLIVRTRIMNRLAELRENFSPVNYLKVLSVFSPPERTVAYQLISERQSQLVNLARRGHGPMYKTRIQPLPDPLDTAADLFVSFFQNDVKYLAPLRDEPKPVYPLSGATDPTDVGFRGEHTAAVLELNRNRLVEYIGSAKIATQAQNQQHTFATLYEAVLDWLSYMGVVSDVSTTDRGKLGHELKVAADDSKCLRDLTHVGVGVSQVLPIVVCSLLAERGSTLIFEQPELHLHPRVQSRLADFFLSMIFLGKQCIVETHSEHLINKLRQQVASSSEPIAQKIKIYFVEFANGTSTYRPVEITSSGNIREWPKGFFDEGEELATEILRAGIAKRSPASKND
jgi:predicted ATPase